MASLTYDYLFVAAIDFGTTYYGYAFSSRDDFKNVPLKIVANQAWNAGSQRHFSLKTPTCLLLDDKEELVSFGYEAENKYSDIVIDRKQNEYIFFQRFKMKLYKNLVSNLCNLWYLQTFLMLNTIFKLRTKRLRLGLNVLYIIAAQLVLCEDRHCTHMKITRG